MSLSTEDEAAIRALLQHSDDTWNAHDVAGWAGLHTEDVDFINVAGRRFRGRAELETFITGMHEGPFKDIVMTTRSIEIDALAPDLALAHIEWEVTGDRTSSADATSNRTGIFTLLIKKLDGSWLIRAAHNTNRATEAAYDQFTKKG